MYIMNDTKTEIINSDFVERFRITQKSDVVLIMACNNHSEPATAIGRYANLKEAQDALDTMLAALVAERRCFDMPDSIKYAEQQIKRDARTKRKGGS